MSSSSSSSKNSCIGWSETETGSFLDAAVDGLRSCLGDGDRLMCAVCTVSASWRGMEDAIFVGSVALLAKARMLWCFNNHLYARLEMRSILGSGNQ